MRRSSLRLFGRRLIYRGMRDEGCGCRWTLARARAKRNKLEMLTCLRLPVCVCCGCAFGCGPCAAVAVRVDQTLPAPYVKIHDRAFIYLSPKISIYLNHDSPRAYAYPAVGHRCPRRQGIPPQAGATATTNGERGRCRPESGNASASRTADEG